MREKATSTKGTTPVDHFIGSRVRERRLAVGMSQQKLADALGVTFPQVQKYENGTNRISVSRLQSIASVLGMDVILFFEGLPRDGVSPMVAVSPPPAMRPSETESHQLLQSWTVIEDPEVRRRVLDLVTTLATPRQRKTGESARK